MKKTASKIIISIIFLLLLFTVAFAVLVYCYSEYEQYEKLRGFDITMRIQSNRDFIVYMAFIYPACLYAFLGNRYLRIAKKIPNKTVKEKFKTALYTVLFFIAGEIITGIPINFILQIIYWIYCRILNIEIYGFTNATASLLGIFSSAVAIIVYQSLLERHLQLAEKDSNAERINL
ncbi:MAG: hypothetical protein K2G60_02410 [Oscillospiraceae bacterium]|nr:hypothetical protein [Oscillospiraceae bacterium]